MEERVHSATRMKKERPKTADPRKTQMLQQRRELVDQQRIRNVAARQNLQQTCSMSMGDLHSQQLEALSLASEKRASGGRPPLTSRPASAYSGADTASVSGRSDAGYPPRPRSAGSVRSYGSSSSSVGSVSSSVRGAAYMKRPPTPQSLRQKCLESRGVSAAVAAEAQQKKKGVSLTPTHQQLSRLLPRDAERRHSFSDAPIAGAGKNVCTCSCSKKDQEEDDRYTNPPRLVRVHAKQYSTRPYTPTKAFSSSCRENR